jgi:hypothetical protein
MPPQLKTLNDPLSPERLSRLRPAGQPAQPAEPEADLSLQSQAFAPLRQSFDQTSRVVSIGSRLKRGEISSSQALYEAAGEALGGAAQAATTPLQAVAGPLSLPSRALWGATSAALGGSAGNWWRPWTADQGVELGGLLTQQGVLPKNDPTKWEWRDLLQGTVDAAGDPTNLVGGIGVLTDGATLARNAGHLTLANTVGEQIARSQRSLLKLQVPFTNITRDITGPSVRGVGDAIDATGRLAMTEFPTFGGERTSPVALLRAAFDPKVGGRIVPRQQEAAAEIWRNSQDMRDEARMLIQNAAVDFTRAGLDTPAAQRELRNQMEGLVRPTNTYVNTFNQYMDRYAFLKESIGFRPRKLVDYPNYFPRSLNTKVAQRLKALQVDITQWASGRSPFSSGPEAFSRDPKFMGFIEGTEGVDKLLMDPTLDSFIRAATSINMPPERLVEQTAALIKAQYGGTVDEFMDPAMTQSRYKALAKTMIDVPEVRGEGVFGNNVVEDMDRLLDTEISHYQNTVGMYDYLARPGVLTPPGSPGRYREAYIDQDSISLRDLIRGRGNGLRWHNGADEQMRRRLMPGTPSFASLRARGPGAVARRRTARDMSRTLAAMRISKQDAEYLTGVIQNTILPTSVEKILTQYVDPLQSLYKAHLLTSFKRVVRDAVSAGAQAFFMRGISGTAMNHSLDIVSGRGLTGNTARYVRNPAVAAYLAQRGYDPLNPEQVATALSEMFAAHHSTMSPNAAEVMSSNQALALRGRQYQDLGQFTESVPGEAARMDRAMVNPATPQVTAPAVALPPPPRSPALPTKRSWQQKLADRIPLSLRDGIGRLVGLRRNAGELNYVPDPDWRNPLAVRGVGDRTESSFFLTSGVEKTNQATDEMVRMAAWLEGISQGKTARIAMDDVNASQVDYDPRNYTGFEKSVARRLIPFYAFTSRMLGFVGKELLSNPGGRMAQTIKASARASSNEPGTPEYIANQASIPLGESPDGTKSYISGFGLMHEDAAQMLGTAITGDVSGLANEALSQSSPLVKGLVETATGRSLFQRGLTGGRELRDMDPSVGRVINNVGEGLGLVQPGAEPVRLPFGADMLIGNSPLSGYVSQLKQLTDTRSPLGTVGTPLAKALNLLSGIRVARINPAQGDQVIREKNQELQRSLGGKPYVITYIPKERLKAMTPEERAVANASNELSKILYARQKGRVKSGGTGRLKRAERGKLRTATPQPPQ